MHCLLRNRTQICKKNAIILKGKKSSKLSSSTLTKNDLVKRPPPLLFFPRPKKMCQSWSKLVQAYQVSKRLYFNTSRRVFRVSHRILVHTKTAATSTTPRLLYLQNSPAEVKATADCSVLLIPTTTKGYNDLAKIYLVNLTTWI